MGFGFSVAFELLLLKSNSMKFARLDDLAGLTNNRTGTLLDGVFHANFQAGRFIPAVFQALLFRFASTVHDLQYLRFVSTAVLAISGAIIAQFSLKLLGEKSLKNTCLSISVGVIAITSTAAASAATWAILAVPLLALPLALLGGVVAVSDYRSFWIPSWLLAFALVLSAAFCYQQFTALAVLPVAMWSAVQYVEKNSFQIKKLLMIIGFVVLALFINASYVLLRGDGAQERVLGGTIAERIHWFGRIYIPRTIDLFLENSPLTGFASLGLLLVLFISLAVFKFRYIAFAISAFISWGVCAAVVFPTQFWASYRLIHPAQIALWSAAAFSLAYLGARLKSRSLVIFLVLPASLALFKTEERARLDIAIPNHVDWVSTRCKVLNNQSVNVFVVNEWDTSLSNVHLYDEYGMVASNFDWTLALSVNFARLELNETGKADIELQKPILIATSDTQAMKPGTFLVIDHKGC
jgi:hypothetical protein